MRDAGIRTIVDPTAVGLGRCIPRIQRLNESVDLNILVATGVYAFLQLPNFLGYRSVDAIAEIFVREPARGSTTPGSRPRSRSARWRSFGLVGDVPRILAAVAAASRRDRRAGDGPYERGAPDRPAGAADPHCRGGRSVPDRDRAHGRQQRPRLPADDRGRGAWLGCDRFGIDHFNPLADRIGTLVTLIGEGYAERIHLSHDAACSCDFMTGDPFFEDERPDYLLISTTVPPCCARRGSRTSRSTR